MSTKFAKRVTPMGIPATNLDYLPDLIEVQKKSFEWFLKEGLKEELLAFSPIKDYTGRLELHFLPNYTFDNAKYTIEKGEKIVIQEKIDGSNTAIYNDNGKIRLFSRSQELIGEDGLSGFVKYIRAKN